MPVRRDTRTGRWFFRATVTFADGSSRRISGVPNSLGPYRDLPQTKIGAQEAERRAIAAALSGDRQLGQPEEEADHVPTVAEYAVTATAELTGGKPSSRASKAQILKAHILPFFGAMPIDGVTLSAVNQFAAAERARGCSPKTINNRLGALSSLLGYAVDNRLIEKPAFEFKQPGEARNKKPRAVPMADVDRLLEKTEDARYRAVILLGAEAGLRAGEIRGLQWGDIDDGQLTVRRALDTKTDEIVLPKHDKIRAVPLSDRLADEVGALRKRGLWVIGRLDGGLITHAGLYAAMVEVYASAGVKRPEQPIHGLRHTFGTVGAMRMPLAILQELMGHEDIKTTMRYVDVGEQQKRDAIAAAFGARGRKLAARPERSSTTSRSQQDT